MNDRDAIDILWDYHHVHHDLAPADLIFVLGSNDARVAVHAAGLYRQGLAPLILFSGGLGRFTGGWEQTEAGLFAQTAMNQGVPADAILIEDRSTNTGENIRFSRELLRERGFPECPAVIAVQKPYMERRTLASLEAQWPGVPLRVTSPPLSFDDYLTDTLDERFVVAAMVGDFQRIIEYPKQGFATPQPVPDAAMQAFLHLVRAGYDSQLIAPVTLP